MNKTTIKLNSRTNSAHSPDIKFNDRNAHLSNYNTTYNTKYLHFIAIFSIFLLFNKNENSKEFVTITSKLDEFKRKAEKTMNQVKIDIFYQKNFNKLIFKNSEFNKYN